jgi:anti-sigma B factor antagonist
VEISTESFGADSRALAQSRRLAVHRAFDVRQLRVADAVVVEVIGEVDLATAPKLADAIGAVPEPTRRVVVDISEVSFLDSSGLHTLLRCQRELEERAIEFRLVCPEDCDVRTVFAVTGLIEPLGVAESREVALA